MNFYLNEDIKDKISVPYVDILSLYFEFPKQHRIIICFLLGHLKR
jgi:hypothetical protein